ncbi:MAG: thiamine-phosphate kinase [Bacteroidetes bacterium]|nr:thiamine-phosphate kinase [Bacteroidota bacterium]NCQ10573.1 thiamine-phosphate kinase [Bacteroidota bacterium]
MQFTSIEKLGRDTLISTFKQEEQFKHKDTVFGIGDDAAVLRISDYESALLSSDTFVESVDFDLVITPLHHLGYKLTIAAISDIFAMNGKPVGITVNLAIPNKVSSEMTQKLYEGIHYACDVCECELLGGDISATRGPLVISISVFGKVEAEKVVYRSGAKIDDAICVTGDLGGAIAGLRILLREKSEMENLGQTEFQPDLKEFEYVVKKQLLPQPRMDLIQQFEVLSMLPTAMIDISQGFVHDVKQILTASGVGARIYQAALPVAHETRNVADQMEIDVDKYALYGGEEYELLFTLPQKEADRLFKVFDDFSVVGKVNDISEGLLMQTGEGEEVDLISIQD